MNLVELLARINTIYLWMSYIEEPKSYPLVDRRFCDSRIAADLVAIVNCFKKSGVGIGQICEILGCEISELSLAMNQRSQSGYSFLRQHRQQIRNLVAFAEKG